MHIALIAVGPNLHPTIRALSSIPCADMLNFFYNAADEKNAAFLQSHFNGIAKRIELIKTDSLDMKSMINKANDIYLSTKRKNDRYSVFINDDCGMISSALCYSAFHMDAEIYSCLPEETLRLDPPYPLSSDLKPMTQRILKYIASNDGSIISDIASEFSMTKEGAGYQIRLLEKGRLITVSQDKADTRKKILSATTNGMIAASRYP